MSARIWRLAASAVVIGAAACGSSASEPEGSTPGAGPPSGPATQAPPPSGAIADAAPSDDASADAKPSVPSRCVVDAAAITCAHQVATVGGRTVTYAVPNGAAPIAGWPTVIYFHGSFVAGDEAFAAAKTAKFGLYQLTATIKALLDRGYAVLAPNAIAGAVWQSNVPPAAQLWKGCSDDRFMTDLFAATNAGTFGKLDVAHLYAMGISSGGFMTSRMAVSYPGKFRALADHSGSYATCSTLCSVPALPADHPPTLLLRGETDPLVPASSVQPYLDALLEAGHEAKLVTDPTAGHEWLALGITAIPDWFDAHR